MADDPDAEERNVYGNNARETLMEDGAISAEEEAFMQGYDEAESEEDDASDDAYEAAFAKRIKKRRSRASVQIEDEEEEYDPEM